MDNDRKVCVVEHKDTKELVPFTLGRWNDIIVTSNREYNLDDLIVTIRSLRSLGDEPDERYFTVMK